MFFKPKTNINICKENIAEVDSMLRRCFETKKELRKQMTDIENLITSTLATRDKIVEVLQRLGIKVEPFQEAKNEN